MSRPVVETRVNIDAARFEEATGSAPVNDDLKRVNCPLAGTRGHLQCGWNAQQNLPRFMAGSELVSEPALQLNS